MSNFISFKRFNLIRWKKSQKIQFFCEYQIDVRILVISFWFDQRNSSHNRHIQFYKSHPDVRNGLTDPYSPL